MGPGTWDSRQLGPRTQNLVSGTRNSTSGAGGGTLRSGPYTWNPMFKDGIKHRPKEVTRLFQRRSHTVVEL